MNSGVRGRAVGTAGRIRVVVVDADIRVRSALRTTIAGEPDLIVTGTAADADAALSLVVASAPCVVLADVAEGTTGAALQALTTLSQVAHCRVVAMSVSGGARATSIAAGAVDFAAKGGDADAILSALRRAGHAAR